MDLELRVDAELIVDLELRVDAELLLESSVSSLRHLRRFLARQDSRNEVECDAKVVSFGTKALSSAFRYSETSIGNVTSYILAASIS